MSYEQKLIELLTKLNELVESGNINSGGVVKILISTVPILGVVCGSLILFFFMRWYFQLKKELIKNGLYIQKEKNSKNDHSLVLLIGVLCTFVGLPTSVLFYLINGTSFSVLGGTIPFFVGLALISYYFIIRSKN